MISSMIKQKQVKDRRSVAKMTPKEQIEARRKREICSLYRLAYSKAFNKSLNGSIYKLPTHQDSNRTISKSAHALTRREKEHTQSQDELPYPQKSVLSILG